MVVVECISFGKSESLEFEAWFWNYRGPRLTMNQIKTNMGAHYFQCVKNVAYNVLDEN